MAVSVAVNWSPPPSSPLFDEGASSTARSSTEASTSTITPSASASGSLSRTNPTASSTASNTTAFPEGPAAGLFPSNTLQPPARSQSVSPQPRSYAAVLDQPPRSPNLAATQPPRKPSFVAEPQQIPQDHQQPRSVPMFGSQFQQQPFGQSTPGYFAQGPAQNNQFAWAQYQQMLQAQAQHFYQQAANNEAQMGAPDSRRRTSSVPQRPAHLPYNDTFRQQAQQQLLQQQQQQQQAFPGVSFAGNAPQLQFRGNFGSVSSPGGGPSLGHASNPSISSNASSASGYHPYRRTQRGNSDVGLPSNGIQFGQLPSMGQIPASFSPSAPGQPTRVRTSSSTSNNSSRDSSPLLAAERKKGMPPASSTSVSAGTARTAPPGASSAQAGLGHLRTGPARSSSTSSFSSDVSNRAGPSSDVGVRTANGSAPSGSANQHGRNESASSISSATGRSAATPASGPAKRPSPLSKQSARQDEDAEDDSGAVYGGSDDERVGGGRSTPMPGSAPKSSKKSGLSSKLRKALSLSNMADIQQVETTRKPTPLAGRDFGSHPISSGDTNGSTGSTRSTSPPRTPDNGVNPISSAASISSRRSGRPPLSNANEGKRSIFNRKFNSSTDNISISSTVSSASVMLRKVGNLGKLARRHSLMGLTNMFNKDKGEGRDGLHTDDFGTMPASADDSALRSTIGKKSKSKKASPATVSISHATVELESSRVGENGMTPAASYVRQHQLQMQMQAEAEAKAARERAEAEANARSKNKGADDAAESRQKMIEKEKERLKSKRGWRKKFGVGGASTISTNGPTGLETTYADPDTVDDPEISPYTYGPSSSETTPVASQPPQLKMSYDDTGFEASFENELLEPPHMPAAAGAGGEESGDEFETDSLRHWGEGIERSRASAAMCKNPKSILKKTQSFDQLPPLDKPFAGRVRANSYDAAPGASASNSALGGAPTMSQMSSTTADVARLDGVARPESPSPSRPGSKSGDQTASARNTPRSGSPAPGMHGGNVLGHHSNSSMPTLSLMGDLSADSQLVSQRSITGRVQVKKKLMFAEEHLFHSTWPAHVYDRRGELATCNRLTPVLAQRIKEELNTYKMEEMAVAPSSRIYTHFFV